MTYTDVNKGKGEKKHHQKKVIKAANKHVKFSFENFAERGYKIVMSFMIEISWKYLSLVSFLLHK